MTATSVAGAPPGPIRWDAIRWRTVHDQVRRLQVRIAKAAGDGDFGKWVLDADIKACFDRINHDWLIANIPMDTKTLRAWLQAGFIDQNTFHHTDAGTPQGGIISPILANMALDGLEDAIRQAVPRKGAKVNLVRYADDFVITAATRELLEDTVIPVVTEFLDLRGLILSPEKTTIVHIDQGFDFLGCNFRKIRRLAVHSACQETSSCVLAVDQGFHPVSGGCTNRRSLGPVERQNPRVG